MIILKFYFIKNEINNKKDLYLRNNFFFFLKEKRML
jgi:hypothetical protein